jgi:hypothetical protein
VSSRRYYGSICRQVGHWWSQPGPQSSTRLELLPVGAPRRDWRATTIGDGMVIIRHPDLHAAWDIAPRFAAGLHLYAS